MEFSSAKELGDLYFFSTTSATWVIFHGLTTTCLSIIDMTPHSQAVSQVTAFSPARSNEEDGLRGYFRSRHRNRYSIKMGDNIRIQKIQFRTATMTS